MRVGHAPGRTAADSDYRRWEGLFPPDSLRRRLDRLRHWGLRLDQLDSESNRSLGLITQVEVMARVFSQSLAEGERTDLDAISTLLRLSRSLMQRRGRSRELQTAHVTAVVSAVLRERFAAVETAHEWGALYTIFCDDGGTRWSTKTVSTAAATTPVAIMLNLLQVSTADRQPYFSGLVLASSVDWLARDLALLLRGRRCSTLHVGPASDAMYAARRDLDEIRRNAAAVRLIGHEVQVLDERAQSLSVSLERVLPSSIREQMEPPLNLAAIVVQGLSREGVLHVDPLR